MTEWRVYCIWLCGYVTVPIMWVCWFMLPIFWGVLFAVGFSWGLIKLAGWIDERIK